MQVMFTLRWQWVLVLLLCTAQLFEGAQAASCTEKCAANWNKCGGYRKQDGERIRMDRRCCDPKFHCVQRRDGYSQCRPKKRGIPATWDGTVLKCEADATEQLPRVSEKDGKCGQQAAACADPYPCCSANGQCGCTAAHCGTGCQTLYGTCGKSDTSIAPPVATTSGCNHAWVKAAFTENNRLRSLVGALDLACDEQASTLATSWSEQMCQTGLSHDNFASRCAELGYTHCAENVLYNFHDMEDAGEKSITQWESSPPHSTNMKNTAYEVAGYGFVKCPDGKVMWTGLYGLKVLSSKGTTPAPKQHTFASSLLPKSVQKIQLHAQIPAFLYCPGQWIGENVQQGPSHAV